MPPIATPICRSLRALVFVGVSLHAGASSAEESLSVLLSLAELRALGIALDLSAIEPKQRPRLPPGADRPFPHRCFGMVSVSNELLAQMQAQGFSLATLCIGLDSSHVGFHPETGAPLTSVRVYYQKFEDNFPGDSRGLLELLIQIPQCFARGNPYGDCAMRYDWMAGIKREKDEVSDFAKRSRQIAELMKLAKAKGAFQRDCSCSDFRAPDADDDNGPELRAEGSCKAISAPSCPRPISRWSSPGSLVYDFQSWRLGSDEKLARRLGLGANASQSDWGLLNEYFEVSPDLPNGYAYRVMTPEGETAKAMVPQKKGRILSVGTK